MVSNTLINQKLFMSIKIEQQTFPRDTIPNRKTSFSGLYYNSNAIYDFKILVKV